jgi:hypothetical protein
VTDRWWRFLLDVTLFRVQTAGWLLFLSAKWVFLTVLGGWNLGKWRVNEPGKDSKVTAKATCPGALVLCERFEGKVLFDPPVK